MQNINLTPETIKAIAKCINDTKAEGSVTTVEDAEFKQDGFLIMVDYEVYAEWKEMQMTHNEFSFNNVEDLSGWERNGASIIGFSVYGDDGEDVGYDESDIQAIENKISA